MFKKFNFKYYVKFLCANGIHAIREIFLKNLPQII